LFPAQYFEPGVMSALIKRKKNKTFF